MTDHTPQRPDWTCNGCGHAYPCSTAQRVQLAKYQNSANGQIDWSGLHTEMALVMAEAAPQMPNLSAGLLHSRFVAWVSRARNDMARRNLTRTSGRGKRAGRGAAWGAPRPDQNAGPPVITMRAARPQNLQESPAGREQIRPGR